MTERRLAKRFRAVDGALAALSPESGRVGQIQNISLHGLAFQYIADNSHKADLHGTVKLQIMFAGEGVWLEGVPVKRVADIDVSTDTSFSQIPLRRACLQFTSLTATQKKTPARIHSPPHQQQKLILRRRNGSAFQQLPFQPVLSPLI